MQYETAAAQEAHETAMRRSQMERFFYRTGWSFVLKSTAEKRWGHAVRVNVAEKGTFRGLDVKGWTNTETGTIFLREEIFDGIDFTDRHIVYTVEAVINALVNGHPINKAMVASAAGIRASSDKFETCWRVAQTVVAGYGVFGHEYCHAAQSEHTGRYPFHMGLEDLRAEGLWMAQDPLRARQGLRACASYWVTHDTSPMAGEQAFDMSKINSHASLLHLYLLICGRGRIGVLDDQSALVTGVRELAEDVLGWETVSDADDIIDRFIETGESTEDADVIAKRRELADAFAALLPKDAGQPDPHIGCGGMPGSKDEESQGQPGGSESSEGESGGSGEESGEGEESGSESGEKSGSESGGSIGEDGESGDKDGESGSGGGGGESSEESGDEDGESGSDGEADDSDADGEASDQDGESDGSDGDEDGSDGDESDAEGEGGEGGESDDDFGDEDEDEDFDADEPSIATNISDGESTGSGENSSDADPDFLTGSFGETVKPEDDHASDEAETSDAFRLTEDQVRALTEVLTEGLEEVSDSEGEAGWAISDEAGAIITSRATSPTKVFQEVFSRSAMTTRNRRLKGV